MGGMPPRFVNTITDLIKNLPVVREIACRMFLKPWIGGSFVSLCISKFVSADQRLIFLFVHFFVFVDVMSFVIEYDRQFDFFSVESF